jgi:Uma2 family endonuclease
MEATNVRHGMILTNLIRAVPATALEHGCRLYIGTHVRVDATGFYTVPDAVVLCGKPLYSSPTREALTNPQVIFEVLSPSTENYDLSQKFILYRDITSFVEYVVIAQKLPRVEQRVRQADGKWVLSYHETMEDVVKLASVECAIPLSKIYQDVEFDNG